MCEDLGHIHPAYQQYACLPDDERIELIRTDRWFQYPKAEEAEKFNDLLSYPPRDRMPCLLLFGATGMGKTKIIRKFLRDHPPLFNQGTGVTTMPVVAFQMPPEPSESDFYVELLLSLGVPIGHSFAVRESRNLARRLLKEMGTRLLILDEVHAMLVGTHRQQRIFLNTIRFLANDLRIALVCVGIDEARVALLTDPQLANRFDAFELVHWRDDESLKLLLASIAAILPLRKPSRLDAVGVRHNVIAMTQGITVQIFRLIETVAIAAIRSGQENIDANSFTTENLVLPLVSMGTKAQRSLGTKAAVSATV